MWTVWFNVEGLGKPFYVIYIYMASHLNALAEVIYFPHIRNKRKTKTKEWYCYVASEVLGLTSAALRIYAATFGGLTVGNSCAENNTIVTVWLFYNTHQCFPGIWRCLILWLISNSIWYLRTTFPRFRSPFCSKVSEMRPKKVIHLFYTF